LISRQLCLHWPRAGAFGDRSLDHRMMRYALDTRPAALRFYPAVSRNIVYLAGMAIWEASPWRSIAASDASVRYRRSQSPTAADADLTRAAAVLTDLRRLTGHRYDEQRLAERALALLLTLWAAVDALAFELIEKRRRRRRTCRSDHRGSGTGKQSPQL
jgi:hypothetical protein